MDTTMAHDHKFWDRMAPGYFKKPIGDEAAYQRKLEMTRRYLTPDTRMLELGCGTGGTAIAHAPYVKAIDAVDISNGMLNIARGQAAKAGVTIRFQQADTAHFQAPAGSYDAVLALSHLHLLDDWKGAIAKAYDLLAPGGVFVSSTVCLRDNMGWFRFIAPIGKALRLLPLVQVFKAVALRQAIADQGFEVVEDWQPAKSPAVFLIARKP